MQSADSKIAKAISEYKKLPEVTDDTGHWDGTIDHLVYWAQHEIDIVERKVSAMTSQCLNQIKESFAHS